MEDGSLWRYGLSQDRISDCSIKLNAGALILSLTAAERNHEAQEHPGRRGDGPIYSRAIHDALHVSIFPIVCSLDSLRCAVYPPSTHRKALTCRTIYNMCTQKPPNDYSEQLYTRYRESFSLYIRDRVRHPMHLICSVHLLLHTVLRADMCCMLQVNPALSTQHHDYLLKELHKRWNNHKIMVRWLSRFFNYLDRCGHSQEAGQLCCFRSPEVQYLGRAWQV